MKRKRVKNRKEFGTEIPRCQTRMEVMEETKKKRNNETDEREQEKEREREVRKNEK